MAELAALTSLQNKKLKSDIVTYPVLVQYNMVEIQELHYIKEKNLIKNDSINAE